MYSFNNPFTGHVIPVQKALDQKIVNEDGKVLDWEYFANLIVARQKQQIDKLNACPDQEFKEIKDKNKLSVMDDTAYDCIFFFTLKPIVADVGDQISLYEEKNCPEAYWVWERIRNIRKRITPRKTAAFLAWLWRDHGEVAAKLYRDLELDISLYQHLLSNEHSQHLTDNIIPIDAQPITDKQSEESSAVKNPENISTIRPPIHFTPTKASKDNPFHEELVTYQGRKELLDQLEYFARNDDELKIWAISGSSGSGKTRLSHEWMQKSQAMQGWDQIILGSNNGNKDHKRGFWEDWNPTYSTLLVIDYLYVYADAFDAILNQCMALRKEGVLSSKKIRILLIDHVFPKTIDELVNDKRMKFRNLDSDDRHKLLFNDGLPLDLDAINDLDTIMPLILREAAGSKVDANSVQSALDHLGSEAMKKQKAWHPLFAVLIGYTLKKAKDEGQEIDVTAWNRRQLIKYYLTKDTRLPWKMENEHVNGIYASVFIAVATARRGVDFEFLKQHKTTNPLLATPVSYSQVKKLCRSILSVPDIRDRLPPFEADILGETFFLLFLQAIQEDDDLRDVFKKPFIEMFSQGDEMVLANDAEEFIGFIARLTRNLCNDDQNDYEVETHWQTLLKFLNPKDFPSQSYMRWAVSVALIECAKLIEELHPQKREEEFNQLIQQVDMDALCEVRKEENLITSLNYGMQYCEWIYKDEKKRQNVISKLLNLCKKFEENQKGNDGITSLMIGCAGGWENIVKLLIEKDADIDAKTKEDHTALMFASFNGHKVIAQMLIKEGADIDAEDSEGNTAWMLACLNGHKDLSNLFLDDIPDFLMERFRIAGLWFRSCDNN
jgi:Ankyrin repeats (3 copies)